jgi:hypothetical protein
MGLKIFKPTATRIARHTSKFGSYRGYDLYSSYATYRILTYSDALGPCRRVRPHDRTQSSDSRPSTPPLLSPYRLTHQELIDIDHTISVWTSSAFAGSFFTPGS